MTNKHGVERGSVGEFLTLDLSASPKLPPDQGTIAASAQALQVDTERDYAIADHMIRVSMAHIAGIEAFFEGTKDAPGIKVLAHRAHRAICDKIAIITAPWRAVRPTLEPKMKAFRRAQEEQKRLAELALQREAEKREHAARQEAARIQREAEAAAAKLRQEGDLRTAREREHQAAQQAQEVVFAAEALADVGVVLPSARPAGGPGEAMPWVGVTEDIIETCRAIGAREIPLMYTLPKRGGGEEEIPIVEISQRVIDYLAKRNGRTDIGVPGCRGDRGLTLRFSAKGVARAAVPSFQSGISEEVEW